MALKPTELLSSKDVAKQPRLVPDSNGGAKRVRLAASAGAELLPVGTPIAYNTMTNIWERWNSAGANGTDEIAGFVLEKNPNEEGVQLDASDDVLAQSLHQGTVYRDDVNTAEIRAVLPGPPTEGAMDTALRNAELRKDGLIVRGLTGVR